jgi:hypothetical protein
MDYSRIQARADALHANAKSGTLKLNGQTYALTFEPREGVYVTTSGGSSTDADGYPLPRFNTRKLTVARQWLREHFAN